MLLSQFALAACSSDHEEENFVGEGKEADSQKQEPSQPVTWTYKVLDRYSCEITGYQVKGNDTYVISVPDSINGYQVTSIGKAACKNLPARSITIPEGVTKIGDEAFKNCMYLSNASFPNSLVSFGEHIFENCPIRTIYYHRWQRLPAPYNPVNVESTFHHNNLTLYVPYHRAVRFWYAWSELSPKEWDGFSIKEMAKEDPNEETPSWIAPIFDAQIGGFCYTFDTKQRTAIVQPRALYYRSGKGGSNTDYHQTISGDAILPSTITYLGVTYELRTLGNGCFAFCDNITSVTISETIRSFGTSLFMACPKLSSITSLSKNPSNANEKIFNSLGEQSPGFNEVILHVPKGTKDLYMNRKGWQLFKTIEEI